MSTVDLYLEKLKAETLGKLPLEERVRYIMEDSAQRVQSLLDIERLALFEKVRMLECSAIFLNPENRQGWEKQPQLGHQISGFVFQRRGHTTYLLFLWNDEFDLISCYKLPNSYEYPQYYRGGYTETTTPDIVIPFVVGSDSLVECIGGDDLQLKIVQILFEHFTAFPSEQDDES